MDREFFSESEEETVEVGRQIAALLPADAVVYLTGDLGAGKTLLVKAMARELGSRFDDVTSPSFAIVHEYPREGLPPIYHVDGYRLSDDRREWMEIGIPELLKEEGLKFIEWPKEAFRGMIAEPVRIEIAVTESDSRVINVRLPL